MDRLIKRYDSVVDADLRVCAAHGVAYQRDMSAGRVAYGAAYLEKCAGYDPVIEAAVLRGRCELVARHADAGTRVLDVGAATGAFIRAARAAGFDAYGTDVNKDAVLRLTLDGLYSNDFDAATVVTLWDTIEHIDTPWQQVLKRVPRDALLALSVPVFEDLARVRESKHYRPGEHLYYWTDAGLVEWLGLYGFRLLERSDHETAAGREGIGAYLFRRDLPTRNDFVAAYEELHASRHYGGSATELYLKTVAQVVAELKPMSILDYGCGRSDLAAHFWRDGRRTIARYDPAIRALRELPEGSFDLTLCCDVLEHVPMAEVDGVLAEILTKSPVAFFTISTKLARARLPDGRNAHVTLLTRSEWLRWLGDYFGPVREIQTEWDHEVVAVAGKPKGAA